MNTEHREHLTNQNHTIHDLGQEWEEKKIVCDAKLKSERERLLTTNINKLNQKLKKNIDDFKLKFSEQQDDLKKDLNLAGFVHMRKFEEQPNLQFHKLKSAHGDLYKKSNEEFHGMSDRIME